MPIKGATYLVLYTKNTMDNSTNSNTLINMQDAFASLCGQEAMRHVRAIFITNGFEQTLFDNKLRFETFDVAFQEIKLMLFVDDFADFFDYCGTPISKLYNEFSIGVPLSNPNTLVNPPPPFEIVAYAGTSTAMMMSLDPINLKWTVEAPYDTYNELLDFLEDNCFGTVVRRDHINTIIDDTMPMPDSFSGSSVDDDSSEDSIRAEAVLEQVVYRLEKDFGHASNEEISELESNVDGVEALL